MSTPTRMPRHDVRNDGIGPYAVFHCDKCDREFRSRPQNRRYHRQGCWQEGGGRPAGQYPDCGVRYGNLFDIEVLDHLIIGQQRYVSLKKRGIGLS